jgi:hypothetical protein
MKRKPPSQRRAEYDLPAAFRKGTRLIVAICRRYEEDEAAIRGQVTAAFREALTIDVPRAERMEIAAGRFEDMVTLDGIFWLIFHRAGIDRPDLHTQERWWSVVARALDEALADPSCVFEDTP